MKPKAKMFRFRDRLPRNGEGKAPRNDVAVTATVEEGVGKIYLYDVIDSWGGYWGTSALEVAQALANLSDAETIHVHLNSPGGEVYEAIAIKNLLAQHSAKTVAVVDGIAASAASFIAASCDEVLMGENTELMIHDALCVYYGNAAEFRAVASELDSVSDNIASIYAKRTGGKVEDWRAVMIEERWYSAEEAVKDGLADRVGGPDDNADPIAPEPDVDEDESEDVDDLVDVALTAIGAKSKSRAEAGEPNKPTTSTGLSADDERLARFRERQNRRKGA